MLSCFNSINQEQTISPSQTPNKGVNMYKVAAQTRPAACEMALPNLCWIAEQQECLGGSLQQIMSITYCVENPSPLFSFTPQQKTNGPHSLLFGWGVNYRPLPIWTATSDNGPVRPPTRRALPGLLCWYHLLMRGHWHLNLIHAWNTILAFGGQRQCKQEPPPRLRVCIKAHCLPTLEAITVTILKQTSAVIVLISV